MPGCLVGSEVCLGRGAARVAELMGLASYGSRGRRSQRAAPLGWIPASYSLESDFCTPLTAFGEVPQGRIGTVLAPVQDRPVARCLTTARGRAHAGVPPMPSQRAAARQAALD